jgi:hypothetical protein
MVGRRAPETIGIVEITDHDAAPAFLSAIWMTVTSTRKNRLQLTAHH